MPQQVTIQIHKLPQMNERDEVDIFAQQSEAAMVVSDIPRDNELAHEQFGHAGCNKMCLHIKRFFYWPSLTVDVSHHCKSCTKCQKHTKQSPKVMPMQEREVVSVPSERVCVDIVGPFPTAKGGFRFLLTYIDMAT